MPGDMVYLLIPVSMNPISPINNPRLDAYLRFSKQILNSVGRKSVNHNRDGNVADIRSVSYKLGLLLLSIIISIRCEMPSFD